MESVARRVEDGTPIERLVVLAPSRTAAQQIRRAVSRRLGTAQVAFRSTTVHGFALGLLRRLGESDADWRLLRAPEQELRIRELLQELGPALWPEEFHAALPTRAFGRQVREFLAAVRRAALDPEDLHQLAAERGEPLLAATAHLLDRYLDVCDFDQSLDYAELVHRARLLVTDPANDTAMRALLAAIIVDDGQELDDSQAGLLTDCVRTGAALHVFGDPLQRTGGFRGASGTALPALGQLPGTVVSFLEQDHVHAGRIGDALCLQRSRLAASLVPPLPARFESEGGVVTARIYDDESAQTAHLAEQIRELVHEGAHRFHDIAVIGRSGRHQLAPLAKELTRYGIPVEVAGDEIALAQQLAVRHLLLALGVAARGATPDGDEARRLLASPLAGVDGVAQRALVRSLRRRDKVPIRAELALAEALADERVLEGVMGVEAAAAGALGGALRAASQAAEAGAPVEELLWLLWDATPWPGRLRQAALSGSRSADHDLDAIVELFEMASRRSHLRGRAGALTFINDVQGEDIPADTGREAALSGRGVRLVTAHRARGATWPVVFVIGLQEGRWPRFSSNGLLLDPDVLDAGHVSGAGAPQDLAAERRLFHVACSRAQTQLHVSAAQGVEGELGRPSRFLTELGPRPERIHGRPARPLTESAVVGALRKAVESPASSDVVRRAAASRLAGLMVGDASVAAADPRSWWGRDDSSSVVEPPGVVAVTGSSLQQLLACPRHWFLARRAKADVGRSSRASVGDVVHVLAQRVAGGDLDGDAAREELARVWDRIPFEAEWLAVSERVAVAQALDRYLAWEQETRHQLLGVEVPFRVEIDVDGTTVVATGTVDRLELTEDGLRVLDIKTGRTRVNRKEVLEHSQLGLYQLAASLGAFDHLAPGVRDLAPAGLVYLRHGDELPDVVEQPPLKWVADGDQGEAPTWVHEQLRSAVATITAGEFPARPCSMCTFCPFADSCPAIHPGLGQVDR